MRRRVNVFPVVITLLLAAACIHKTGGSVTPWERVTTYNAALAQANNTVEQGAEAMAASGLATPNQVAPIIAATGQVATLHVQVTAIVSQGTATTASIASVQALLDQIKATVNALPPATLGIKNPKSQQAFSTDFNNIYALADAVLTSLQAAGVSK